MSRFEEDDDEELEDFLQGYSKTLAVGYFDCRRISRDGKVITEEITPTIRKFCKEATEQSKLFKLYISDAGGYDIFLDIKRKESTNEATWYDNEAQELVESFDYDYESIDEGALKDFIETIKNWKTSNDAHSKKVVKSDAVSDEDYEKLKNAIEIVKKPDVKYNEYIKAFTDICTFCHTIPAGTIITKYDIRKGNEKDKNYANFEYAENTKKMRLPDGVKLFHMSKVPGIKNLIPQFKGKSEKGYLYDKPRIYFTINKYMPKFLADYNKGEKVYKYEAKEDIKDVYVDPLVWSISQGAVYVETNTSIPVEEVDDNIVKDAIEKVGDTIDSVNPLKKDEDKDNNEEAKEDKQEIGKESESEK
jgi:hypothetical protein